MQRPNHKKIYRSWLARITVSAAAWLVAAALYAKPQAETQPYVDKEPLFKGSLLANAIALRSAYQNRQVNAQEITQGVLKRIEQIDSQFNAVLSVNPEPVLVNALKLDTRAEHDDRVYTKLLSGVPILIKDNIETREWPTTAGSQALQNNITGRDAEIVTALRENGAIIIGKTNLSEWANFRSEHSISGWSAVGGQTYNAHDISRSPCGSSAGSAVAVALGYVPIAVGTETSGSIVCPAAVNGVVGFKPTRGLISTKGIIPLALTQDTAGPFANSVTDASLALAAMISSNSDISKGLRTKLVAVSEGKSLVSPPLKLGVLSATRGFDTRRDAALDQAIALLKQANIEVVATPITMPYPNFWDDTYDVLLYEFKRDLNSYLSQLPNSLNDLTLKKLIEFNQAHATKEMRYFGQEIFYEAENLILSETEYAQKLASIKKFTRQALDDTITSLNLDGLIGITLGPAWSIDTINGDAFFGPSIAAMPAIAGNPHITVPTATVSGMPIGLSFIGSRYGDAHIASIAAIYEAQRNSELYETQPVLLDLKND